MKTIGLTGGIATGKSTVARQLRALGVPVLDADQISRQIVAPGAPALDELVATFGPGILDPSGALDRPALGQMVMANPVARATLERITHPRIAAELHRQAQALQDAGHALTVFEAALMIETGSYRQYTAVILVSCSPDVQLGRLSARQGWSTQRAQTWLSAQLSSVEKHQRLDHAAQTSGQHVVVIDNDGDLAQLQAATLRVWTDLSGQLLRR